MYQDLRVYIEYCLINELFMTFYQKQAASVAS